MSTPTVKAWLEGSGWRCTPHPSRAELMRVTSTAGVEFFVDGEVLGRSSASFPPGAAEPSATAIATVLLGRLIDDAVEPIGLVCVGPLAAQAPRDELLATRPTLTWLDDEKLMVVWNRTTPALLARTTRHLQRALGTPSFAGIVQLDPRIDRAESAIDFARAAQRRAQARNKPRLAHDPLTAVVVADESATLPLEKVESLRRLDLRVLRCRPAVLQSIVARRRPVAIIVSATPEATAALQAIHDSGGLKKTRVIWVGEQPAPPQFTGAVHVVPGNRLVSRLMESVGSALGIKQRRHLRADEKSEVSVLKLSAATPSQARLVNLSESGAKLQVDGTLNAGDKLSLSFQLPTGTVEATARVVRHVDQPTKKHVAVEFDPLPTEMAERIARFVEEALPESQGRRRHRRRDVESLSLKARMRPTGQKTTNYLTVVDLSEGGFLARSAPNVASPLEPGMVADIVMSTRGRSFTCKGGVIRREETSGCFIVAIRFLELDRSAYGVLRSFLAMVPAPPV